MLVLGGSGGKGLFLPDFQGLVLIPSLLLESFEKHREVRKLQDDDFEARYDSSTGDAC